MTDQPTLETIETLSALDAQQKVVREHTLNLHVIGQQLSEIESWFWTHLADIRDAARQHLGGPLPDDVTATPTRTTPDSAATSSDTAATDQLRADANAWRLKAIRRALTASRLRGTIDACIDLADEPVTDRTAWGDGYRAGIADLREVLREFGHLQPAASGEWLHAGTSDLSTPDQPQEQQ
jgi:hypothetical protein